MPRGRRRRPRSLRCSRALALALAPTTAPARGPRRGAVAEAEAAGALPAGVRAVVQPSELLASRYTTLRLNCKHTPFQLESLCLTSGLGRARGAKPQSRGDARSADGGSRASRMREGARALSRDRRSESPATRGRSPRVVIRVCSLVRCGCPLGARRAASREPCLSIVYFTRPVRLTLYFTHLYAVRL